ncbi:MAG: YbjN domain-containing protein [Alphaproteobacteria bacterium]
MSMETSYGNDVANPLDSVEELLLSHNWVFNRVTPDELMVEVAGKTGLYRLFFLWQQDMNAMQFCCQYDLTIPEGNRDAACRAAIHLNEGLWMGHFDIPQMSSVPTFRQTCLFRGTDKNSETEHIEDLVDISLAQCERNYPLFQFLAHADNIDEQKLTLAVMETAGQS